VPYEHLVERPHYRLTKRLTDGIWTLFMKVRYPKLAMVGLSIVLAYLLFREESVQSFFHSLGGLGYASAFTGGMLFAIGFGAAFGVGILLTIADDVNILLASVIGGLGALITDYLIFKFIRLTFDDEIDRLKNSNGFSLLRRKVFEKMPPRAMHYLAIGVAGIVISSPLPDEFGVAILASTTTVKERIFSIVSFSLNTVGILLLLGAGSVA